MDILRALTFHWSTLDVEILRINGPPCNNTNRKQDHLCCLNNVSEKSTLKL